MLTIYTEESLIPEALSLMNYNDSYFRLNFSGLLESFDGTISALMGRIDGALYPGSNAREFISLYTTPHITLYNTL